MDALSLYVCDLQRSALARHSLAHRIEAEVAREANAVV